MQRAIEAFLSGIGGSIDLGGSRYRNSGIVRKIRQGRLDPASADKQAAYKDASAVARDMRRVLPQKSKTLPKD